jgi:hypothetical protein
VSFAMEQDEPLGQAQKWAQQQGAAVARKSGRD